MMTEIREIFSLVARALALYVRKETPRSRKCIYLERRDDDSEKPNETLWTGRDGMLQLKKARSRQAGKR